MKERYVTFWSRNVEDDFDSLKEGNFEDKELYLFIERAISDLKMSNSGTQLPKRLWPKEYIKRYNLTNLWKYDLPKGWRLIYTIKTDEVQVEGAHRFTYHYT